MQMCEFVSEKLQQSATTDTESWTICHSIDIKLAFDATNLTFDVCNFYHIDMPKINFKMSNNFKR
jgi:hypothetical protein